MKAAREEPETHDEPARDGARDVRLVGALRHERREPTRPDPRADLALRAAPAPVRHDHGAEPRPLHDREAILAIPPREQMRAPGHGPGGGAESL